eukprot:TRINITY_DN4663_c0_g2_i4.p1 TRINITY_DN4663_c0_g2~~TRINITY_DN4663_c0_g2_i4.p1  ORF type:complete len:814 (+),score=94.06 TRINITY_DN4663_c0_g2_i4:198-2639(+)
MVSWGFSVFTICTYVHFGLGARTDSRMVQLAEEAADVTLARARSSSQNPLNIAEAEEKLRNESPQLLTEGEHVEMAIKKSRGVVYFTNIRVLVHKNGHGVNRNKTTYRSLPYKSVKTFAVQTGGEIKTRRWLLGSTVLKPYKPRIDLYTSMPTLQVFSLSFHKDAVNIFEIGNFFASKIFDLEMPPPASSSSSAGTDAELFKRQKVGMGDLVAMAGGDAEQIDAREFEERLRANASALGIDETVELAFQVGRTATLLTSRRILRIRRLHRLGRGTIYLSIPYEVVQAFRVENAGRLDLDAEFDVWTDLPGLPHFKQDLRKDKADVKAIQALVSNKVLGVVRKDMPAPSSFTQASSRGNNLAQWLTDNHANISTSDAERVAREHSVLQDEGEEWVELAFSLRRDMNIFTNKRLIKMDVKGLKGTKVQFTSIKYQAIRAFGFQTAGGKLDRDEEVMIYTGVVPPPPIPQSEGPDIPPCPREDCVSYIEFDLRRGSSNLLALQQFLSEKVFGGKPSSLIQSNSERTHSLDPFTELHHLISQNAKKIDASKVEDMLKAGNVLLGTERVLLAFKIFNDLLVWTDVRFLNVDNKRSLTGKKTMYLSVPYSAVKAFGFTSAGSWDSDSEITMWTDVYWQLSRLEWDIRKGKNDEETSMLMKDVMHALGDKIIRQRTDLQSAALLQKDSAPAGADVMAWLGGDADKLDASETESMFRENVPVLFEDEHVKFACRARRSTTMLTTNRAVQASVIGLTGKRRLYLSVPYTSVGAFKVRTAGRLDRDSEVALYLETADSMDIRQDLRKDKIDILEVAKVLSEVL